MLSAAFAAMLSAFQPAPCAFEGVPEGFEQEQKVQCGWVVVPRRPGEERTIRLWTARVAATGPDRKADPILYINGGPGIATVDSLVPSLPSSPLLQALREDRDIIVFDQRGSGRSEEILCPDLASRLSGISSEGLDPAEEEGRNREAFAKCRTRLEQAGTDLQAYSTAAIVADMEAVRPAFRADRWNLLSVSYGSLVALHAMRTHPGHDPRRHPELALSPEQRHLG